jgi:hypothetical protein
MKVKLVQIRRKILTCIILLSLGLPYLLGSFFQAINEYGWMFGSFPRIVKAQIVSYDNFYDNGFWQSSAEIRYFHDEVVVNANTRLRSIPISDGQKSIWVGINVKKPAQFVTLNWLLHFMLFNMITMPIVLWVLCKNLLAFYRTFKILPWSFKRI